MPGTKQQLVELAAADTAQSAVEKLNLKPNSVIALLGECAADQGAQVRSIFSRVVAPLALDSGALIIDGGTSSGCAALMGQAASEQDELPALLSLLDHDDKPVDENHRMILRLPAEWTEKAKYWTQIIGALIRNEATHWEKPVIGILFGGGEFEKETLVRFARHGWPAVVMQGSGGLADEIAKFRAPQEKDKPAAEAPADPDVREIVETAKIYFVQIDGSVEDLNRILLVRIDSPLDTLRDAWARHDDLCEAAGIKQNLFKNVQGTILILGAVATLLAIGQSDAAVPMWLKQHVAADWKILLKGYLPQYRQVLHILILLVPLAISVLVASNSRFREGNKWILLRAASEALQREIFRYRARACAYSDEQCEENSRESKLAARMKDISSALVQSEVNKTNIPSCPKDDPKRLDFLTPEKYIHDRLEDQANWYVTKTARLYRRLKRAQLAILIVGSLGTFLAAIRCDVWVALTTAIATGLAAKVETDQVENTLAQYNVALTNLRNVESWWKALSQWEKGRRKNIDLLVDQTEKALEAETLGWVQQMQAALDKLTEKEEGKPGLQRASEPARS